MRCPRCQQANDVTVRYCRACDHRLFTWLGDPFGNLEAPAAAALPSNVASTWGANRAPSQLDQARDAPSTPPARGLVFPWRKAISAVVFVWLVLASFPPGMKLLLTVTIVVALFRWPRIRWPAFVVLLCAASVAAALVSALLFH